MYFYIFLHWEKKYVTKIKEIIVPMNQYVTYFSASKIIAVYKKNIVTMKICTFYKSTKCRYTRKVYTIYSNALFTKRNFELYKVQYLTH